MKILFLALTPLLVFSANSFASSVLEKSLASQNLLRKVFQQSAATQMPIALKGKTPAGIDCVVGVLGMNPETDPKYSTLLVDMTVAGTATAPDGLKLTFDLDENSEPEILVQNPEKVFLRQTDIHQHAVPVTNLFTQQTDYQMSDFGIKDLLEINLDNGKLTQVSLSNDGDKATCILLP